MGDSAFSRTIDFIVNLPTAWLIVWLGLVAISIALIVLMRTRWGQSQPLRKCAVLSLLVHALFGCFATTVKIVSDTQGNVSREEIRIALADYVETAPQLREASSPSSPWEAPSLPEDQLPDAAPKRQAIAADSMLQDSVRNSAIDNHQAPAVPAAEVPGFADPSLAAAVAQSIVEPAPAAAAESVDSPATVDPVPIDNGPDAPALPTELSKTRPVADPIENKLPTRDPGTMARKPIDERAADVPDPMPVADADPLLADAGLAAITAPAAAAPLAAADVADATKNPPPTESPAEHETPKVYQERTAPDRLSFVRQHGGSEETEAAVAAALAWLVANQEADGRWDSSRHGGGTENFTLGHDRQGAGIEADTGITGLALLALLGAGNTHEEGEHREPVRLALNYLLRSQAADGNMAGKARLYARMYCHGMATLALSETYAMTGDDRLRDAVESAIEYTLRAQDRRSGGWRYQPGDAGDMSQHGWQVMALRSAELAGVHIPATNRDKAARFLDSVKAGSSGGLARYRPGQVASRTMTAEALFCRQLLGVRGSQPAVNEATTYLVGELPGQQKRNLYYWYYATLALYQEQGEGWQRWNDALKRDLLASQRHDGVWQGSWDTDTVWGGYGGRVYSTAMSALCLEVYYRYLPLMAGVSDD